MNELRLPIRLPVNKGGRKSGFTKSFRKRYLKAMRSGMPHQEAARLCGVSPTTALKYRHDYPDFAEQVETAIAEGNQARLDIVIEATKSEDENIRLRAACWLLTHCPSSSRYFSETSRIEMDGELDARALVLIWPHQQKDLKPESKIENGTNNPTA